MHTYRRLRTTATLASLVLSGLLHSAGFAQGVIVLGWDTCAGPIDKSAFPGSVLSMYISVTGQTQLHKAYDVRVGFRQPPALRDAWRFDAAGCQGSSRLSIEHVPPAAIAKTCPAFMQNSTPSLQITGCLFDASTGRGLAVIANSYPSGVSSVNPQLRYFLGRFSFDQGIGAVGASDPGVSCGGIEVPLCIVVSSATWLTLENIEIPWAVGQEYLTTNAPGGFNGCPIFEGTPARATTWGAIRHQYR